MSKDDKTKNNELVEPLIDEDSKVPTFEYQEMKIMIEIGWPMLISFFCRMGMASVDSAFVGHITNGEHSPADYLAAAGLADMVTNILVIPPLAFNQSLNALVSQAMGSGNKKMAGVWLQQSLFWLTIGYLPCLVSFFYVADMLHLLGFSPEICTLAGTFAKWNVFWPIPNGWYQCMRFYFQAQGISRPAMYNNMVFLGVNALLNWIFVFGGPFRAWCGWEGFGFPGAAMSLSASRSLQPLFYWLYMFVYKGAHHETWPGWSMDFLQRARIRTFMNQSLPQVGTLILQSIIGQSTTLMIAQLGNLAIAGSSAAQALTQIFSGGLSAALRAVCGIRVGFHLGAGQGEKARKSAWIIFKMTAWSIAAIAVILIPFGHYAVSFITVDPNVIDLGARLIPAILLNTFASLIVGCNTGGVFTSQGRTKLATFLSMGVTLPLSVGSVAFLVLVCHANLIQVYWAQALVSCLEMAICMAVFIRSDWFKYAQDAKERQEVKERTSPALNSPGLLQSPAALASPLDMVETLEVVEEIASPKPVSAEP